jgi:two-component system chemotaxis family response regulator WspR
MTPEDTDLTVMGGGHHVLIVDDSEPIRSLVREALGSMDGVSSIHEATDGVEGLAVLSRTACDLVITDVTMPRLDGFKLVSAIRQNPRFSNIMIILLSSLDESVDKIRGLTIGANDYVTKPFEAGELRARVSVMFKMRELQEELQGKNQALENANRQLELLANQDGLTGIPNRRYFFERLEVEFLRARRLKIPLGLLMIDIDHFKAFNDSHGHLAGDEALRRIAGLIQRCLRTYDMVGRYGGEELIVFLPETMGGNALAVAERLRAAVASLEILPPKEGRETVGLTVSIGAASLPEIAVESVNELVEAADTALYRAKSGGRNRAILAEPGKKKKK